MELFFLFTGGTLCEYQNFLGLDPNKFGDFNDYLSTLFLHCPPDAVPGILEWQVAENTPDVVYYQVGF